MKLHDSGNHTDYYGINRQAILTQDIANCLIDNYDSELTRNYMKGALINDTKEYEVAFKAGMAYAANLFMVECFKFSDFLVAEHEIDTYNEDCEENHTQNGTRTTI